MKHVQFVIRSKEAQPSKAVHHRLSQNDCMRLSPCPLDVCQHEFECFVFGEALGDERIVKGFFLAGCRLVCVDLLLVFEDDESDSLPVLRFVALSLDDYVKDLPRGLVFDAEGDGSLNFGPDYDVHACLPRKGPEH